MVNFGQTLRNLRTSAGMTQAELAKQLNITKSVVSYYELQERIPSPEILIKLATIFHVTSDYLLGIEHKRVIDVSGLTDEDMQFLMITIDTLRRKNKQ